MLDIRWRRCVKNASRLGVIPTVGAFYSKRFKDFGLNLHRFIKQTLARINDIVMTLYTRNRDGYLSVFVNTVLEPDFGPALITENTSNIGM